MNEMKGRTDGRNKCMNEYVCVYLYIYIYLYTRVFMFFCHTHAHLFMVCSCVGSGGAPPYVGSYELVCLVLTVHGHCITQLFLRGGGEVLPHFGSA